MHRLDMSFIPLIMSNRFHRPKQKMSGCSSQSPSPPFHEKGRGVVVRVSYCLRHPRIHAEVNIPLRRDDLHECDTGKGGPVVLPYKLFSLLQGLPFIPEPLVAPSLIAFVTFP